VLKCTVANVEVPCFSKDAFQDSLTMYGPCCTFNMENKLMVALIIISFLTKSSTD